MDLSAPISFNGLTVSPPAASASGGARSGVEFRDVDVSSVDYDGYMDGRALQDGMDAADVYARARHIAISGSVYGSTKGDLWDRMQDVNAAFNPVLSYHVADADSGFQAFSFRQPTVDTATWTAGYIPMFYNARPVAAPRVNVNRMRTTDDGRGLSIPFSVSLVCKDPRKYSAPLSLAVSTTAATATYRGDYPTWPIVTFTLSSAGSSAMLFNYEFNGDSRTIILDLSGAYTTVAGWNAYTLNLSSRTLVRTVNSTSFSGLIDTDTVFSPFMGGSVRVSSGFTGISTMTMTYNEAWA